MRAWAGVLLLWAAGAAMGQSITDIQFDHIGDSSVRVIFDVSSSFNAMRVRYGTSDCSSGTGGTVQTNGTSPGFYSLFGMTATLAGLAPEQEYYVCPEVSSDGGMTWSSGAFGTFVTQARGQVLPIAATPVNRVFPGQTGAIRNVASDCSNLQAQINAASYGDTIVVPAGTVCTGNYVLPVAPEAKTFAPSAVRTSDSRITLTGHGFTENQLVRLSSNGCLPGMLIFPNGLNCDKGGGWRKGGTYYVHVVDANNVQLLDGVNGSPVVPGFIPIAADSGADTITFQPSWYAAGGYRDTNGGSIAANAPVQFHSTGTLPGGLSPDTTYYLLTACPANGNAACTTQVAASAGGMPIDITGAGMGTHRIVDRGSGTHYIMAWPPQDKWIVVTTSGSLPPPGVRITPDWDAQLFRIRQTQPQGAPYRLQTGTLSHNWRFVGALFDTATNDDYLTSLDPRPYGRHIFTGIDSGNILFERSRVQGPGYPNRFGTISMTLDGTNVGWIDSDMRGMDYWHPWFQGLGAARNTDVVATLSAGTAYAGIFTTALTTTTTITITGGTATGTGYVYFAMDGTLKVLLPTGMTATCVTTGTTCTVLTSDTPNWPVNGLGRSAALRVATLTLSMGILTGAGNADAISSAEATEGTNAIIAGNGPGPFLFDNNWIEGAGLPLHFDDSGGPFLTRGDYNITRNTFSTPQSLRAFGPGSNNLRYMHRQPLEWKGGSRVKIDGNLFDGSFAEVSPVGINIAITPRSGGFMSDVDVTNNTFRNTGGGVNLCTPIDSFHPVSAPCARQRFANNLFLINGYVNRIPGVSVGGGWAFYGGYAAEDILLDHNTIYDNRGPNPALLHWIQEPVSGMRITNNIYFYTGNAPGLQNENTANCPGSNKTLMDCAFTDGPGHPSYMFTRNLLVPSWSNTATPSGFVGASTVQNAFSGLVNSIPTGGSVAANLGLVKFAMAPPGAPLDTPGLDLRLAVTSPYLSIGTDGEQAGANLNRLQQAQGRIVQVRTTAVGSATATVSAFVPDAGETCYVGYGTSKNPSSWTWTPADFADSRQRNIELSGLSPSTAYFYGVGCRRTAIPGIEAFHTQ